MAESFGTNASTSAIPIRHPCLTGGEAVGYLNLIEITRGIVIDRRPEQIAQVANRSTRRHLWRVRVQSRKLLLNLRRKFRLKAVRQNGLFGCRLKVEVRNVNSAHG